MEQLQLDPDDMTLRLHSTIVNLFSRVSLLPAKSDRFWREEERPWERGCTIVRLQVQCFGRTNSTSRLDNIIVRLLDTMFWPH